MMRFCLLGSAGVLVFMGVGGLTFDWAVMLGLGDAGTHAHRDGEHLVLFVIGTIGYAVQDIRDRLPK